MLEKDNFFVKDKLESEMNPSFLAEEVGGMGCMEGRKSDGLMILEVCCRSSIKRNSVFGRITGEVVR